MLVAAKWRDFADLNPHTQPETDPSSSVVEDESRNSRSSRGPPAQEPEDEEEDEDEGDRKKKSRSSRAKKGKKASKVPTLKIKLGKRKRGSSVSFIFLNILRKQFENDATSKHESFEMKKKFEIKTLT